MRRSVISAMAWLMAACTPSSVLLVVDLKSDLVAGAEIFEVRISLPEEGLDLDPIPVDRDSPLSDPGVRIAELDELPPRADRRLRVAAIDSYGAEVSAMEVIVDNELDRIVTVVLTRDCLGVSCPGAGSESATRCLGMRCVEPECLTGAEPECPDPECTTDADCGASSGCVTARCNDGVCLEAENPDVCAADEFCHPDDGCQTTPTILGGQDCEPLPFVEVAGCGADCTLRVQSVGASDSHTCVVDDASSVLCFGSNEAGQLGTGDRFGRLRPLTVALAPAQEVHAGIRFTCALLLDGAIRCWGENTSGQLGVGDFVSRDEPADPVAGGPWRALSVGAHMVCAIDETDALFCWGENAEGELGLGQTGNPVTTPMRVDASAWSALALGQAHVIGIQTDGSLHCWGRNSEANCGQPEGTRQQILSPMQVGTDTDWSRASSAQSGTCAIKTDGSLYCWGDQVFGSMSLDGIDDGIFFEPQLRSDGMDWVDVGASVFHGCGLRGSDAWCWGRTIEGQLGTRQNEPQLTPQMATPAGPWADVEIGRFTSFLIRDDGALFGTGANCGRVGNGELGRPDEFVEITR